jgi:RNA polymerase sigma-70 factor (ECF subfamily)
MLRELVEAARRGDQAAFMQLVDLRGDRLYAIAVRILRDEERAKDALQDALVLAWRQLPKLREAEKFDAWMQRLLTHACIDHARRERRAVVNLRLALISEPTAQDEFLSLHDRDQLERGFKRLKAEHRAVLVLRHYAGYEPSEIAELLRVPAGTVRSRLHHAYRVMRAALDAEARATSVITGDVA